MPRSEQSKYDAKAIQLLGGLEHVRKRPGMYVGSVDVDGYHHILREAIDNCVDEYLDGHATMLVVGINTEEQTAYVRDNGRGIPVSIHPKAKIPALTAVFTKLHAGGKFGKGAYAGAVRGLHGVGIKATNALSEWLEVWTVRRKKVYYQRFERGKKQTEIEPSNRKLKSGTLVKFKPDTTIFKHCKFNPDTIKEWLQSISYLCPGLKIILRVDGKKTTFMSENGISDMLDDMVGSASLLHESIFISSEEFVAALVWTDGDSEQWRSFVNTLPTPAHGTHVDGLKKAIRKAIMGSDAAKGQKLRSDDLRDGLVAIVHARVSDPEFQGQTKNRLGNKSVEDAVLQLGTEALQRFIANNSDVAKRVVSRAVKLRDARTQFKAQQQAIRSVKVKQGAKGVLPGKLCEATECPPSKRELFIVEGDSASGPVKQARVLLQKGKKQIHFQEVLPLRGKTLNTIKNSDIEKIVNNKEIKAIIQAIGTGIGDTFDVRKARHRAVYLLMDADPDGAHINALMIAFFAKFMPELIEAGMLYVVLNPLFMGVSAKKRVYGATKEEVKKKLGIKTNGTNTNVRITRFKGLGESDAEDLQVYAMDPSTRKTMLVQWDGEEGQRLIMKYMGQDSTVRKQILDLRE